MTDRPEYLLHVGYPKAASSWLQRVVFSTTPEIDVLSTLPEFRAALTNLQTHTEPYLEAAFRDLLADRHRHVGKPMILTRESLIRTPLDAGSGDTFENADRLAGLCPGARVLIVVRRQQDLLPSLYSQYVHEGGTRSFADVLADKDPASPMDLGFLDMARVVEHYKTRFGTENVIVAPFELLRQYPDAFLDLTDHFLGISLQRQHLDLSPVNLSTVPALLPALRMWNRLFRKSRFHENPPLGWMPGHLRGRRIMQGRASDLARRLRIKGSLVLPDKYLEELRPKLRLHNASLQRHVRADLASLDYVL